MSHKLGFAILLVFTLLLSPAVAQPPAKPAPPQQNTSDALTPEQAKRALDTLQDDKKRGEIINTLRAIATASPQAAQSAQPAPEPS
ncbi:small-conductance mechanosensitive channel, partial [Bradyrhizobium sp. Arg68]|nr:small-conductance mechanosensitive channel [Bradyrhizobium ivorense]